MRMSCRPAPVPLRVTGPSAWPPEPVAGALGDSRSGSACANITLRGIERAADRRRNQLNPGPGVRTHLMRAVTPGHDFRQPGAVCSPRPAKRHAKRCTQLIPGALPASRHGVVSNPGAANWYADADVSPEASPARDPMARGPN